MKHKAHGKSATERPSGPHSPFHLATDLTAIRAVCDCLPQLAWSCRPDGYCDYLSRRWVDYTGVPEAEHHGIGWLSSVHPDDRTRTGEAWAAFVAGDGEYDVDYRLRRHDGAYRWFKTRGLLMRDGDGAPVRVVGTTTDIDEQKRAEERSTAILESISDAFYALSRDWRFTYVNREAERLLGRARDDLVGKNIWEEFPPALGTEFERSYRKAAAEQVAVRFEAFYQPHDRWYELNAYPSPAGLSVYFRDITERLQAVEANAKFRAMFEQGAQFAGILTPDGVVVEANRLCLEFCGYGRDDVIGRPFWECGWWNRSPALQEMVRSACREAAAGRQFRTESVYFCADGTERVVDLVVAPVTDETGKVLFIAPTGADITDRRRAEAAVETSEGRFRALVTATSDVVYRMSADWAEMQPLDGRGLVASTDQPIRNWMAKNIPAFEQARVGGAIDRAVATRALFELEHQVVRPDGTLGWTFSRAVPIVGRHGEVVEWFGTASDVTSRKRAEAELARVTAESEQRKRLYETILSNTPDFVYVFSLDHRVLYANEALIKMWGHSPEDTIGKTFLEIGYEPWHAEMHGREIDQVRSTRRPIRGEVPFTGTLGRRIYDYIFVPVLGPDGEVEAVAGTTRDVTERKRDEERQTFLAALANAAQPLTDPAEVTAVAARLLAEHLGVDRCAYAEVEDEAVYVITGDHCRGVPSIVGRWGVASFGAEHHRLMKANEPYVVHDADADSRIGPDDLAAYRATAIQAVICVPLHKDGKFTAAMAVHQKVARQWSADEIDLVRTVVGRCWDALERARVVRRLKAGEEQLRLITDTVPALIAFVDSEKRYAFVNRQYEDWFNRPRSEVEGRHLWEVVGAEAYEDLRPHVERGLAGERFEFEAFAPYPAGDRYIHARFVPQFDGDRVTGYYSLITDVTERARAVLALRDADRRKDEFIALLAHELRNPLAPLRNGLQVLHLAGVNAEAAERARAMMDRQLSHMVRLIDDLLDVSRIGRGKLTLRRERLSLWDVVSSAVETARPAIEAAGHELALHLPSDPVFVDADLTRLAQVFANLLTNSAKYTRPGGRITLAACRSGAEVVVSVTDTGIGIPGEALPVIFDMFSQVDRSIERSTGGLGIGLALVKGLAEMHGGSVAAESPGPGRGSTFTVRLPAALSGAGAAAAGVDDGPPRPRLGLRVLVVDDNRDSAESMALMLGLLGGEVRTAHDGLEAVEAADAFRPEVILMDVGMPRLNGLDATRRIRERPWGRAATIVALTGWGQEADRQRSRDAGCDGHLVKPVELRDLRRLLSRLGPEVDRPS